MADFYGTATGYRAYWTARGRVVDPTLDDDDIQAALLVASDWLDNRYRPIWGNGWTFKVGQRDQVREWPRSGYVDYQGYGVDSTTVPIEVQNATYEAAYRELASAGSLTKDYTASKYKSASVDGAVSVTYNTDIIAADVQLQMPEIDAILYPLNASAYANGNLSGKSGRAERV